MLEVSWWPTSIKIFFSVIEIFKMILRFFLAFTLTITNMSSGITEVCFGISVAYRKLDSEHMLCFEVSDVTLTAR